MKNTLLFAGLVSLISLSGCHVKSDPYQIADVYSKLRTQVLNLHNQGLDIQPIENSKIIALLMEVAFPRAVATLSVISDGTVSLYFSNGGGAIGLGQHENIRLAGIEFIQEAGKYLEIATKTGEYPLPKRGEVLFYLITEKSILTLKEKEKDLSRNKSDLSTLFWKGQNVITQYRITEQERKNE